MPPSRFENLERVAWERSREFRHDPKLADYQYFFAQPEWQQTLDGLSKSAISNIIVASGSGFRNHGSRALGKELGVPCLSVGKVDDELKYSQFQSQHAGSDDVIEYQREVSRGKFLREEVLANGLLDERSLLLAMDEIILIWQKGNLVLIEKPESKEEAIEQIMMLSLGQRFIVSNSTSVGSAESIRTGRAGVAVQLLPMRIACKNLEEREELINASISLYEKGEKGEVELKPTPGAFSLLHPLRQPYMQVLLSGALKEGVIPWDFTRGEYLRYHRGENEQQRKVKPNRAYVAFAESLLKGFYGIPFLDLPANLREEVGMTVGGLSMVGLREACNRFLTLQKWVPSKSGLEKSDPDEISPGLSRMRQMQAMLTLVSK